MDNEGIIEYPLHVAQAIRERHDLTVEQLNQAEEHIREDHRTLKQLFDLHFPVLPDGFETFCNEDGFIWPCRTRRILTGED